MKLLYWIINKLSRAKQKAIVIYLLNDIVNSSDSSIDDNFANFIVNTVAKSNGNKVTAFIYKD